MQRTPSVASRWAVSTGTLLAIGGGLVLYQMTSLVLGSANSRELHLTLTIPALEVDESSLPFSASANLALGMPAGPASVRSASTPTSARRRASGAPAARRVHAPVTAPVVKTPPVVPVTPVGSPAPRPHPTEHPLPPIVGQPDQQTGESNRDVDN